MSATTTARASPVWGSGMTPLGMPQATPPSVGQVMAPLLSADPSKQPAYDTSPSYFNIGLDSNSRHNAHATSPQRYKEFQRQVSSRHGDTPLKSSEPSRLDLQNPLLHRVTANDGATTPLSAGPSWSWREHHQLPDSLRDKSLSLPYGQNIGLRVTPNVPVEQMQFKIPKLPITRSGPSRPIGGNGPSFPASHAKSTSQQLQPPSGPARPLVRAETSPASVDQGGVRMITPQDCKELLVSNPGSTLILDVRPFAQFSHAAIKSALNLCIPTTLLKRPSFNIQRIKDTLAGSQETEVFSKWQQCTHIIVYDAGTTHMKDAQPLINVLKKFTNEGWHGEPLILKGGFTDFSAKFPDWMEDRSTKNGSPSEGPLSPGSMSAARAPPSLARGCFIPNSKVTPNPFFNNIRQATDLADGVGQIPVRRPAEIADSVSKSLPPWLSSVCDPEDRGKAVSSKFLEIEKLEQSRMQEALSNPQSSPSNRQRYRIAGIEKGTKNRYNNIYPYEHCRVRLQKVSESGCDYINASHVKASRSNKSYIATQAPIPSTFNDFWNTIWEQDVRLIVALTAESEGLQLKCHPYWQSACYGPLQVELVTERTVPLPTRKPYIGSPAKRSHSRRDSTSPPITDQPHMIVRHLTVIHSALPFAQMREITQIQYSGWPDFGTPAKPGDLLGLVEEANRISNAANGRRSEMASAEPEPEGLRKMLVHCSAGCGRTGTFCTVDSVIDMLKRQRRPRQDDVQSSQEWVRRNDVDLISSTVEDFRCQRLSMVQSLRQFVLCYESILEWLATEPAE